MLSNITIGQYFPGNSFLHRMDPRVKIVLLLLFLVEVFVRTTSMSFNSPSSLQVPLIVNSSRTI